MTEQIAESLHVQVVSIYATGYRYYGLGEGVLPQRLKLGRPANYDVYKDQLPRWIRTEPVPPAALTFADPPAGVQLSEVDIMLFAIPSDQVVLSVLLGFRSPPLTDRASARSTSEVLERCITEGLRIEGRTLAEYLTGLAPDAGLKLPEEQPPAPADRRSRGSSRPRPPKPAPAYQIIEPERHQLVLVPRRSENEDAPTVEVINEIVFRDEPPYREEFGPKKHPEQLNQEDDGVPGRQLTLGVVTPYASLIYGHQDFVEASILLSTVHAVGTASRFRQIWQEAYRQVRIFRKDKQRQDTGQQDRDDLEDLADSLGNLEFDLTFSVEFPLSARSIESFHSALYAAMDLPAQAQTLSQMFNQLGGSVRSEITAIDIREKRLDEARARWNAVAAGILSVIGVSVGFVVAFLGVNASQVDDGTSMFDPHYAWLYFLAGLFALTPLALIMFPYLREWSDRRSDYRDVGYGLGSIALGVALGVLAEADDRGFDSRKVPDAVCKSIALFLALLGVMLLVLRAVRALRDRHLTRTRPTADPPPADPPQAAPPPTAPPPTAPPQPAPPQPAPPQPAPPQPARFARADDRAR